MPQFNPLELSGNMFLRNLNLNPDRYHLANRLPHPGLVPSSIATVTVSKNGLPIGGVGVAPTITACRSELFVITFVFEDKIEAVFFVVAHDGDLRLTLTRGQDVGAFGTP